MIDFATQVRFWSKADQEGDCLIWRASTNGNGYGQFYVHGREKVLAHQVAFEIAAGHRVPAGREIHHVCGHTLCVNPAEHFSIKTRAEHVADHRPLATHCARGHEFTPENTYVRGISAAGRELRTCRRCRSESQAARDRERRS